MNNGADGSVIIDLSLDYGSFEKDLGKVKKSTEEAGKAMEKSANPNTKGLEQYKRKQEEARKSAAETKKTLSQLQEVQKNINQLYRDGKLGDKEYQKLKEAVRMTSEELKSHQKEIEQSAIAYEKAQETAAKFGEELNVLDGEIGKISEQKFFENADFYKDTDELDRVIAKILEADENYRNLRDQAEKTDAQVSKYTSQMGQASQNIERLKAAQEQTIQTANHLGEAFGGSTREAQQAEKQFGAMEVALGSLIANGIRRALDALQDFATRGFDYIKNLETMNVSLETTFGSEAAAQIDAWSQNLTEKFGLSEGAAKGYVSALGLILDQAELSKEENMEMSTSLVELIANWASFTGLEPEKVFEKIKGGLTGNVEGLRELGISLDQATLDQYAFEEGLGSSFKELDENEKKLVRYKAIVEQSDQVVGNFAANSENLGNQQQILKAQLDETAGQLAETLMPTVKDVLTNINAFLTDNKDTIQSVGEVIKTIIAIAIEFIRVLSGIPKEVWFIVGGLVALMKGTEAVGGAADGVIKIFSLFGKASTSLVPKIILVATAVGVVAAAIAGLIAMINVLIGRGDQAARVANSIAGKAGKSPQKPKWYAIGAPHAPAGYAIVGENGPELVRFSGGEQVWRTQETAAALSSFSAPSPSDLGVLASSGAFLGIGGSSSTVQQGDTIFNINVQGIDELQEVIDLVKMQKQRSRARG